MKTILSLFDYSGAWSNPYREAGYNVIQVDIKHGDDIMTYDYKAIGDVYGVLAAPPCTCFVVAGAMWWPKMDESGRTANMIKLTLKTLEIIDYLKPKFHAIENPVGRINKLIPEIGTPWYFNPCDYGDPYTKKTGIYGEFVPPLPIFLGSNWSVKLIKSTNPNHHNIDEYNIAQGIMDKNTPFTERAEYRSLTPAGFAKAFFICNQ